MVILFPIAAFFVALAASLRSIGLGLVAVFAVGYVSGVIRANFLSVHTTFMFDSALWGSISGSQERDTTNWSRCSVVLPDSGYSYSWSGRHS